MAASAAPLSLALLAAAAAGTTPPPPALPEAHALALTSQVSAEEATLGEPFSLRIDVTLPTADSVALPEPLALSPLALRGKPGVSRRPSGPGAATTSFTLPLVNDATLEPRVPDLQLVVQGPAGLRALRVPGRALRLRSLVAEEGAISAERAHHGPKPPVPVLVRSYLWAGLLGGLLALAAAVVVWRKLAARRRARIPPPPPPSAEDEARGRLSALRARAPWVRGAGRAAIFEVSEIVRAYLGRRLGFHALDLTREELIASLRQRQDARGTGTPLLFGLDLRLLDDDLAWQDLVKFARVEPTADECVQAVDGALRLVEANRQTDAAQRADAPGRKG